MKDYNTEKIKNRRKDRRKKKRNRFNDSGLFFKFLKGSVCLILVGAMGALGYILIGHLYTSSYFNTRQVLINGEKKVAEMEVLNLAGIDIGHNILNIKLKDVSKRIEQHPWVEKALVKRRMPGKIVIEIKERSPIIKINLDRLYLVDRTGVIFKEVGPEDKFDIPVLTGLESEDPTTHEGISAKLIEEALAILDDIHEKKILDPSDISEVNMDTHAGLTLFTVSDATQIKLGDGNYGQKLSKLKKVLNDLEDRYQKAEYINLTYGDKVYVKLNNMDSSQNLLALRERRRR